ncbi:hypothetical protein N7457_000552 [Penicillium paradoxum]|uniref:uncharacterized protein n=1 Tax=Penicillium paradoxum TaxID=176176 RepID=UPI0025469DFD|nr:uncharacterized protein N7457_000552 [Penicillium paradoxum]KAJ5793953.1 hypothetical protein N7457_000552 [Penicillium paradoxum]
MQDALRPSKADFETTLHASYRQWLTYFNTTDTRLPLESIDLTSLLKDTPAYLAAGLNPRDKDFSFACVKKHDDLEVKGHSKWRTSRPGAKCITPPKVMPLDLQLGVPKAREVELSSEAPLSEWPGVRGISGLDEGNHISVLFLAWAYIFSAKWAELLDISEMHRCTTKYSSRFCQHREDSVAQKVVEIDLPPDTSEAELVWWNAVLSGTPAWEISVAYKSEKFLSPWSISVGGEISMRAKYQIQSTAHEPPPSTTAFQYLTHYCTHHHIYAQCSASLSAALLIQDPFFRTPKLPIPKPANTNQTNTQSPQSIPALISKHKSLLPYYMTLSSSPWTTMQSMCSVFFNPDIPCNLVAAWINPAFAIINPLVKQGNLVHLLSSLSARQPRVASLWLGATILGIAGVHLNSCKAGLMSPSLEAEAWMGMPTTFITQPVGVYDENADTVQREDECKLLFLATDSDGSYNHGYLTCWSWKPFGNTRLCDVNILVREHLCCGCHDLGYEGWSWDLDGGLKIEDSGVEARFASLLSSVSTPVSEVGLESGLGEADISLPKSCEDDLYSDERSSNPTRGIFSWLRLEGYPANEKGIYQHEWVTIMYDSEEEIDDKHSDDDAAGACTEGVGSWLQGVEV